MLVRGDGKVFGTKLKCSLAVVNKVNMIFTLPFFVDAFRAITNGQSIDLVLFIVASIACLTGSTLRVFDKNLQRKKAHRPYIYWLEIAIIYIVGILIGSAAYFLGDKWPVWAVMTLASLGSFVGIDLLAYAKKRFPAVMDAFLGRKIGAKIKDEENDKS